MKSFMKQLLGESFESKFDFGEFITNPEKAISKIQSCNEMSDCIRKMTMGYIPFNPPEPLRSIFRTKFEDLKINFPSEFNDNNYLKFCYDQVSGEYKPTPPLPDGAMY